MFELICWHCNRPGTLTADQAVEGTAVLCLRCDTVNVVLAPPSAEPSFWEQLAKELLKTAGTTFVTYAVTEIAKDLFAQPKRRRAS